MSKIKVGDKLVCIKNTINDQQLYFTIDKLYEIASISDSSVHLKNDYLITNYFLTSNYSCALNLWDFFEIPTIKYYRKQKLNELCQKSL